MENPERRDPGDRQKPPAWEDSVDVKEQRKIRARREKNRSVWFGFGMFGMVGWSIVVPTVLGIFLGIWIDQNWPSQFSWTLMLMLGGLIIGSMNAWSWVQRESEYKRRNIRERKDDER